MSDQPQALETKLLEAARRILRPLVRILMRNGITANTMQEVLRKTYVDVGFEEFTIPGRAQTLARVSVITGLNRKEVARLHNLGGLDESDILRQNRAATVVTAWLADPTFHTSAGFPLDLPMAGEAPNFTELVKKYSGDMYPKSVADELLRIGAVEWVGESLRLSSRGYVTAKDPATLVDHLGVDTAELIETIDYNLQAGDGERLLQYKILSDNLPEEHLPAFNALLKRVARQAIDEVTHWLNAHDQGKDRSGPTKRYTAGLGLFQINQPTNIQPENSDEAK